MKLRILSVVAVTLFSFGSPAEAKGASELVITGAGLARPIVVEPGGAFGRIIEATAFFDSVVSSQALRNQAALRSPSRSPDLGPRVRLTWSVEWFHTQHVVQDIYPYARGGPLLHTPDGQQVFDQTTAGGWYRAAPRLVDLLQSAGVPSLAELRTASTAVSSFVRPAGMIIRW
jgi:hypothetical protein